MKKLHHHFIHHLRSYRTFNFLFFTFLFAVTSGIISYLSNIIYAEDLLEKAFEPAFQQETIINLGKGKNAVGNEVFREGVGVNPNLGIGCIVNGKHISEKELTSQMKAVGYTKSPTEFCQEVLGGDEDIPVLTTEPPLIVRIAKFFLRITMVLAITMVIYNGIMRIIESSRGAEIKDAKKNITLIVVGILIALMSLMIINLISSITISSLGTTSSSSPTETYYGPR